MNKSVVKKLLYRILVLLMALSFTLPQGFAQAQMSTVNNFFNVVMQDGADPWMIKQGGTIRRPAAMLPSGDPRPFEDGLSTTKNEGISGLAELIRYCEKILLYDLIFILLQLIIKLNGLV